MRIAIAGRRPDIGNYVKYVRALGHDPLVTLDLGDMTCCEALLLPGGGDITPAFFGEQNRGSRNIDTELDILQLQALELCLKKKIPVLGICKGLQIINVGLGGTLYQDMPAANRHSYDGCDKYHASIASEDSWLYQLYGGRFTVNSAHHQAIKKLGDGLSAVQHCPEDGCIEAVAHREFPILGVQWHPERIDRRHAGICGEKVLDYFVSLSKAIEK